MTLSGNGGQGCVCHGTPVEVSGQSGVCPHLLPCLVESVLLFADPWLPRNLLYLPVVAVIVDAVFSISYWCGFWRIQTLVSGLYKWAVPHCNLPSPVAVVTRYLLFMFLFHWWKASSSLYIFEYSCFYYGIVGILNVCWMTTHILGFRYFILSWSLPLVLVVPFW